jgi:hypothetical protein
MDSLVERTATCHMEKARMSRAIAVSSFPPTPTPREDAADAEAKIGVAGDAAREMSASVAVPLP